MTPERWEQIRSVLEKAIDAGPDGRVAVLDQACSSDASLRQEVEAFLDSGQDVVSSFLRSSPAASDSLFANLEAMTSGTALRPGQVFAERFQLVRKLGEGGMGQVWLAEQTSPVKRQVALKLIRAGMYDESVVQRFQMERQSLAIMDHPSIAKIFDAGMTPQGQPYFVMEYVPGLPITEFCDQKKLNIRERLELFIQACDGVQHAHRKAIVHRDLKPANILVVEVDGKPVPRIIDFGLAKAVTSQNDGESLHTQMGHFVGTPGYMSPEQADPGTQDIDTRTDVYSLGVVLYVLLTGARPFDAKANEKLPLDELFRRLREEDPPSPSDRVSADRETSKATAEARGTEPRQLAGLLRGDLNWITLKAIEKQRERRYGSAAEFAADIRHCFNHESIVARPASTGYRLRKYVRRNRVAVGIAAGLVVLLGAFSAVQAIQLRRITRERDRANRITNFMTEMFKVPDPRQARGSTVTAREILDKASAGMANNLSRDPEAQTQMMQVMANTYTNLGLYPRAHELAQRALEERQKQFGSDDRNTLESMALLGWILSLEGHNQEGEKLLRQALTGEHRSLKQNDPLTIDTAVKLCAVLNNLGHYGESETLARQAIHDAAQLGPESPLTMQAEIALARSLLYQSRYAEAEPLYRQLIEVERRTLGADHPQTLRSMGDLAVVLADEHRRKEAEQKYREVLILEQRVFGPEHRSTVLTMENLAEILTDGGHLEEGEKLHREVLAIRTRIFGPEHPDTLLTQVNLADVLLREGRMGEAEKLQRETLAAQVRVLGPESRDTLESQSNLAGILIQGGRYAEAERLARQSYDLQLRAVGPLHTDTIDSLREMGEAMALTGRYGEASKLFTGTIGASHDAKDQSNLFWVWFSFACVAEAANRHEEAIQYLQEAINRGYKDPDGMMADDDLKNLHKDPRFLQLVAGLKDHS